LHLEEEEQEEAFSNNMILVQEISNDLPISPEVAEEAAVVCKEQISTNDNIKGKEVAMLSTAIVTINDVRNEKVTARVLLDSGSS
jgi:hypothetical protein